MNKVKFIWKRSVALLMAVLLLLSTANMIIFSASADDTQKDYTPTYTVTTTGINFKENSGNLVYSVKQKVPVYTYSETTGTDGNSYVQITVGYDWQNAVLTKMTDDGGNPVTENGNYVWEMQSQTADSAGLAAVESEKIHLKTGEDTTEYDYAVLSSKSDEEGNVYEMKILIKENGEWKKVTVQKTEEIGGTEEDGFYDIWKIKNEVQPTGTVINASPDDVIQIKTEESEIQVILSGKTSNNSELLFMPYEGELDSIADNKTVTLNNANESSKTANFVVQAPEHQSAVMKKIWQDNGEPKSSDLIAIGVKYYLVDDNGDFVTGSNGQAVSKTLINAEIAAVDPDTGDVTPQVNHYEDASLTRYKNISNLEWDYTFEVAYLYDENGNKRQFYLYETKTPDGYIQKLNSEGHLVNIKKVEYNAAIKWNDGNDSYNTRPTPEEWFDKILYQTVTNEQGETEKVYNPSVYRKSDSTQTEQLNPVLIYKIGYQPLKKDLPLLSYVTMEDSEYKTAEEIEEYNNDISAQNNAVTTANGNDSSGINGYNKQIEDTNRTNDVSADDMHSIAYLSGLTETEQANFDLAAAEYKAAVEAYEKALNDYQEALADYNSQQEEEETVPDTETFNEAIAAYNAAIVAYNQKVEAYNTFVSNYNAKVKAHNDEVDEKLKGDYKDTEGLIVIEPVGDTWKIKMPNALGFDENNNPYAYYIVQNREGESYITAQKETDDRIGTDNKYAGSIENSGNYASNLDGLYTGGTLTNTLSGNAEFHVAKYWGDNGTEGRPSYELDLYHYAEGGSYINATPASSDALSQPLQTAVNNRGDGIVEYVFKTAEQGNTYNTLIDVSALSEEEKNRLSLDSRTKYEYDFGVSYLPKFDAAGYMYVYFVKERQTGSSSTGHTYNTSRDTTNRNSPFRTSESLPISYALNGDMLKNVLSGNSGKTITKTWDAESRQDRSDKASFIVDQYKYLLNSDGSYRYENLDNSFEEITSSYEKMYLLYDTDENGKFKMQVGSSYVYVDWNEITFDAKNNATVGGKNASFAYKYVDDIYSRDDSGNIITANGVPQLKYDRNIIVTELVNNGSTVTGSNQVRVLLKTKKDTTVYDTYATEKVTYTEYEEDGVTVKNTYQKEQYKLNYGGNFIYRDWKDIYEIDPINGTAKVIFTDDEYLRDEAATQAAQQAENELAAAEGREPETVDPVYKWVTTKKEETVKLVYKQVSNIYIKDANGQYTTTPMQRYNGEGKVVWLDPDMSKKVSGVEESDGFTKTVSDKDKYINTVSAYTVSDDVITYANRNSVPKTDIKEGHYSTKELEGFSQDVKSLTESLGMPRYDADGYEYIYKVYEGNVKTMDDAEYAKVEQITDANGDSYYLITTDKGYTYESRETFENGSSIVRNKLVGNTYLQTKKSFAGNFPVGDFVVKYNVYRNGIRIGQTEMNFNCYQTDWWDENHKRYVTQVVPKGKTAEYSVDGTINLNQYNFTPNTNITQGVDYSILNEGTADEKYAFNRYTESGASYNYEVIEVGMYYEGTNTEVACMNQETLVVEEHEIGDRYGSDDAHLVIRDEVVNIIGDDDGFEVESGIYKEWRDENQDLYRLPIRAKLQYCTEVVDGVATWIDIHTYTITPAERFKEFEFERVGSGENAVGEKIPGTDLFVVDELAKWKGMPKTDENGNPVTEPFTKEDGTVEERNVLEDRIEVKCGDIPGNFRVIEVSLQEKDGTVRYVEHEDTLVNAELIEYLRTNIGNIKIFLQQYAQNHSDNEKVVEFVQNHITNKDDLESYFKSFLDSHSDKQLKKYLENNIRTADDSQEIREKYNDLADVFKAFLGVYYTEEFYKYNIQNDGFKAYYLTNPDFAEAYAYSIASIGWDAVLEAIKTSENGIQTVQGMIGQYVNALSNEQLENYIKGYFDYKLTSFREAHPEHHAGYSFVQTNDQNYDVSAYAEINFETVNETKPIFDFGIVNTRVGVEKLTISKQWIDGQDYEGQRPDAVEYTITASKDVFDKFTLEELAAMQATYVTPTQIKIVVNSRDNLVPGETDIWYYATQNLPKYTFEYDSENPKIDGAAINYTVSEGTFLKENNGTYEPWSSHLTEYSREQLETVITTPVPNNHTGDRYDYSFVSRVSGTANLVTNKYWMDADGSSTSGIRPDIKTIVYRSYTKIGDDHIPYTVVEKVGQMETNWIGTSVEDDSWWQISYGSLPKYTPDGYVINYYIEENITTESTQYQNTETFLGTPSVSVKSYVTYHNRQYTVHTSGQGRYIEIGGTKYNTAINADSREYVLIDETEVPVYTVNEAVIDNYNDLKEQFYTIKVGSAQNVLVNNGGEDVYIPVNIAYKSTLEKNDIRVAPFIYDRTLGEYVQGTLINKPVSDRDISGRKIWENLPLAGAYPSMEMPDVVLTLYRYSYDEMEQLREQGMLNNEGYPETVDSAHIVRMNHITKDKNNEEYTAPESDYYTLTLNGIPDVTQRAAKAITAKLENYESFDFDENKFDRYDDNGKPYTYVLYEGYVTTVEVWRYKEGESKEKARRVYTQKLNGPGEHNNTVIGTSAFPTDDGNGKAYHYFINQVDGTESVDESYTFAYKMTQSEEHGIVITNLYHDDQDLTIKFTKKWKGLPDKLSEDEMPTAAFKLVRYIQRSSGANQGQKLASTKEVINFKEHQFGFQRYVTVGEERIYLQHRQYVTYKDERYYITKEGTHLIFNDLTKVYKDAEDSTVKYIVIDDEEFYLEQDEQSVIVGNEVYRIESDGTNQYAVIPVKESNKGKYVTIGYNDVYVFEDPSTYYVKIGENYYNIENDADGDYIAYTGITGGNVIIGENTYEIKTEDEKSYIEIGDNRYYLDTENRYVRINVLSTSETSYELLGQTTDSDGNTRYDTVQVTYTGSAASEFEVEWTDLAYYAPNMKPYIYEIEEIGVTDGFTVRALTDADYINTSVQSVTEENGSARKSYTENGVEKNDYATSIKLSADKKDRTALSAGIENVYGEKKGYIRVQKEWKNDTGYTVSPRPSTLDVNLYRTFESSVPSGRTDSTASSKYYSSDIYVEKGVDNNTAVDYVDTFYTTKMPENHLISIFDPSYTVPSDKTFELSGNTTSSSWDTLKINNLQIYSPNGKKYYYYVTEKVPAGYTQETASVPVNAVQSTTAESGVTPTKLLNTLVPTTAKATKVWKYDDTPNSNWSSEEMLFASNLSGIAKSITYRLVYATRDLDESGNPTGEWSNWDWLKNADNGYVEKTTTMNASGVFPDAVWTAETDKLPNYIRVGGVLKAVRYMPVEYSVKYAMGDAYTRTDLSNLNASENKVSDTFSMGFVSGSSQWTNTNTSDTVNTVQRQKITVRKDWGDEYDRDKLRDTAISFDITRKKINTAEDSQTIRVELKRENAVSGNPNVWERSFYVPVFANNSNSVYSEYTITEVLTGNTSTLYSYQTAVKETDSEDELSYTSGKVATVGNMKADKTAYFDNSKSRMELTITPSKLWYMVETEQYPKENSDGDSIEIPDWLKEIIFPEGNMEKLKIRFKLQYQIVSGLAQADVVPSESKWKDVSEAGSDTDFVNVEEDLRGIAPYLEFKIDKYGNISKNGTADKWEHLPRHYLTKDIDTYATYFYRIQEIIVKDGEPYTAEDETTFSISYSVNYVNGNTAPADMVKADGKEYYVQTDSNHKKIIKTDDAEYEVKTGADGREYIEIESSRYYLETEVKIQTKNSVNYMRAEVNKQWNNAEDSNNDYATRPDAIAYEFQYRPTGTEEWKTVENGWIFNIKENGSTINVGEGIYETIDEKERYIIVSSKEDKKVNYDVLIQELPSSDSSNKSIEYRFVESYLCYDKQQDGTYQTYVKIPSEHSLYTKTESTQKTNLTAVNPTDPKYKYVTTVTNTLQTTSLTVTKKWGEDLYRISDNVASTQFIIERRVKTGEETYSDWKKTADSSDKSHSVYSGSTPTTIIKSAISGEINGQFNSIIWEKLPKYDLQNREYEYRAVEKSITTNATPSKVVDVAYGNGGTDETYGSVGGFGYVSQHETVKNQETEEVKSYRSEFTNTPVVSKLAVTKEWDDENNRDGIRKDITITLKATLDDGTLAKISIDKSTILFNKKHTESVINNDYYYVWYKLPLSDVEGNPITYVLTEPQTEAYTSKVSTTSYHTENHRYESTEFAEGTAEDRNGSHYYSGSVKLTNIEESATYDGESKMNGEALIYDKSHLAEEAEQLSGITKVEFKNIHVPRYLSIGTNKVWKSDDGVEDTARPPQGVIYTLKYRETGSSQWQDVLWEEWSELYDTEIDGTAYDVTIDNSEQNINSTDGWNTRWNHLPVYKKGSEGVKFEYRIVESGKPYPDGRDGLYNYYTTYGNQNKEEPDAISGSAVTESEESVNSITEIITNTLRTFILTKKIDPGYIGETKPELYDKKFKFSILITDENNEPIETLKMSSSSNGIITQTYNADPEHPGLAKMELSHGESIFVYNIPGEMYYTIVEDDYYIDGFKAYITVNGEDEIASTTITGSNSAPQEIVYINRTLPLPATGGEGVGIIITVSLFFLVTAFAAGGIYYTVSWKRRNDELAEYLNTTE